jgi:uncharacterized protein
MPTELGYFTIPVKDLARAKKFYSAVFGWEYEPQASHATYAHVGNTKLPFGLHAEGVGSIKNMYFRVTDLTAARAAVEKSGGRVETPFESKTGKGCVCYDPDGTAFSIWQFAPGF